jgi:hypothetical protein
MKMVFSKHRHSTEAAAMEWFFIFYFIIKSNTEIEIKPAFSTA